MRRGGLAVFLVGMSSQFLDGGRVRHRDSDPESTDMCLATKSRSVFITHHQ